MHSLRRPLEDRNILAADRARATSSVPTVHLRRQPSHEYEGIGALSLLFRRRRCKAGDNAWLSALTILLPVLPCRFCLRGWLGGHVDCMWAGLLCIFLLMLTASDTLPCSSFSISAARKGEPVNLPSVSIPEYVSRLYVSCLLHFLQPQDLMPTLHIFSVACAIPGSQWCADR